MSNISILILTKNEEHDLADCLRSVAWSDDVHVLDSCSDDSTVKIAEDLGAAVHTRAFDGYASQRNFGLHELPMRNDWVLLLDADERVPAELVEELSDFVANAPETTVAGQIRRRDFWGSQWLKHAQISPFFVRLVRRDRVHYEREINEVLVADGEIGDLSGYFDHYPFSKGLDHWLAKHNSYSRMEAKLTHEKQVIRGSFWKSVFARDFTERRQHQKALFYRLPGRPLIKLLYMLVWRRAFLDGLPGIRYSILQSIYEYYIVLKTQELEAKSANKRSPRQPSAGQVSRHLPAVDGSAQA